MLFRPKPAPSGAAAHVVNTEKSSLDEPKNHSSSPTSSLETTTTTPKGAYAELPCPPHTTPSALLRRIDLHILPFVVILYLLAFLDRVNIANAKSFSLTQDLGLTGNQYNTALTIFFVPYILFEIPANILLKKLSPRLWLPLCGICFGVVTVCQGVVQNFGGLMATRFFLGMFESAMFPGCFYLLSMWYKREEAQKRFTFFFASTSLAGAFGGLLASAIGKMDGLHGYHGWRWIFILEGTLTVVVCIIFLFFFPTFPEGTHWLNPAEKTYIQSRLAASQGPNAISHSITLRDIPRVLSDYKVWLGGFMYMGLIVPAYSYAFFAPAIISTFHYDAISTQLHSVPPWACSFALSIAIAFASDYSRHRFLYAIFPICLVLAGFSALFVLRNSNTSVAYGMLFLVASGAYSAMPIIVCWFNMNLGGHTRRAIGAAWQVGFGNIGGIIATYAFLASDAPEYRKGYAICIGFVCLSFVSCVVYAVCVVWENGKKGKMLGRVGGGGEGGGVKERKEREELGDLSPMFRYML